MILCYLTILLATWLLRHPITVVLEQYCARYYLAKERYVNIVLLLLMVMTATFGGQKGLHAYQRMELKKAGDWLQMRMFFLQSIEMRTVIILSLIIFTGLYFKFPSDPFMLVTYWVIFLSIEGLVWLSLENVKKALAANSLVVPLATRIVRELLLQPACIDLPVPTPPPKSLLPAA